MRYAHETKDAFIDRVKKEKGFHGRPAPITRKRIQPRPVEEILADQVAHQDRRARGLFQFGPAEKWRKA